MQTRSFPAVPRRWGRAVRPHPQAQRSVARRTGALGEANLLTHVHRPPDLQRVKNECTVIIGQGLRICIFNVASHISNLTGTVWEAVGSVRYEDWWRWRFD